MAEGDSSQEKTEEPTAKRLQKAREDGQIPRSKELSTSLVLIVGALSLWIFGGFIYSGAENIFRFNFALERSHLFDEKEMVIHLSASALEAILVISPVMIALIIAAVLGPLALGGWMFSGKSLLPKLSRISPLAGFKRMFGLKSLVELLKSWAKVLVIAACTILLFFSLENSILYLNQEPDRQAIIHAMDLVMLGALALAISTLLISIIDVPFQIYDFTKKMKMSLQEVKDEHKDTEGKPEVKQRIRRLQYEMSQRKMMQDVPEADVVITNPTHYAVALKYHSEGMEAPVLVAKGADEVAMKIREIAKAHKVPIVEAPALARSVYTYTRVGKEIPEGLYVAIAQVLAFVYQLNQYFKGLGPKPKQPVFPVPPNLRA
ncbi:flagellar biosynthesis protein FlhB [Bermanella sp. WJH001]|uniref:flagellar biosynthesis protein FlhB n=1 Tax=Bermanella sp. WJH001 TaxID=3048005 RepID=UPI0024BE1502|nr:flagellar biosynthesis protein FlhB [Bermanella sp. WJH001]MDJ1539834.1 flagellar biosynthesis protein FlhB [Bermanella sp. WJH001]